VKKTKPIVEIWKRIALRNENIVVSLTTTPYRIDNIGPILETLYAQNVKISKIFLSVPYVFKRDNIEYKIPQWLLDDKRITLIRSADYGPATKILGLLKEIALPANTIIITVDDDMYYPSNLVLHLAYAAKQYPHDVIVNLGGDINYDAMGNIVQLNHGLKLNYQPRAYVDVLLGYAGVAYRSDFFDKDIFALDTAPAECFMHDDLYISFHLARRNINRRNLGSMYTNDDEVKCYDPLARQPQSLFIVTPSRASYCTACLSYMHSVYPNVQL
jgi:hypothetical protein